MAHTRKQATLTTAIKLTAPTAKTLCERILKILNLLMFRNGLV